MNKLLISLSLLVVVSVQAQEARILPVIHGIYGSPGPFWKQGYRLDELGVNAIFVRSSSIDQPMIDRAREEGLRVYAEFPTLNGKGYVEEHPEAWAINDKGVEVEAAGWFMGVCPTEPGFRQYRQEQLRNLLKQYEIDGVWMDYVHWHAQFEEPEPILPETCFCDHCLSEFQNATDTGVPEGTITEKAQWILSHHEDAWRDWRCKVIADWVSDFKDILTQERPGTLLGLYHCPWSDEDFDGARRRILGLDYGLLKEQVDVFSPMVYHERMGRPASWVAENIQWFSQKLASKNGRQVNIWPIVQAYQVGAQEFELVLNAGLSNGSTGVMMFTGNAVAEDKGKVEVMKNIYQVTEKQE